MLRYDGRQWTRDEAASAVSSGKNINALRLDANGE
jgi:hypothetical protein